MKPVLLGVLSLGAAILGAAPAFADRVALVIGNRFYQNLPDLDRPHEDAQGYAETLTARGYTTVTLKFDLDLMEMQIEIGKFIDSIRPGDEAAFVYSGHGWSDGVSNFLLPVDAPALGSADEMRAVSTPLRNYQTGVLDLMDKASTALKIAVIDACRDSPFAPVASVRSAALTRGLVSVAPPQGSFVVFSAGTGEAALDNLGRGDYEQYSVFTRVFLPLLRNGAPLLDAVKETQTAVSGLAKSIGRQQNPAYYDQVTGRPCLGGVCSEGGVLIDPCAAADMPPGWSCVPQNGRVTFVQSSQSGSGIVKPPTSQSYATDSGLFAPGQTASPGERFRERADLPEMISIPAGWYIRGAPESEGKAFGISDTSNERPMRRVDVPAFALSAREVTFDDWRACVAGGGCQSNPRPDDRGWGTGTRPVIGASWNDAQEYVAWINTLVEPANPDGPYRLPSEAEWEYAARAGTETAFWWGKEIGQNRANCDGCGSEWGNKQTAPAGSFDPNPFGLYDMHGNVWEWVEDCYAGDYSAAPADASSYSQQSCSQRVLRGGSWGSIPRGLRSASRDGLAPVLRSDSVGFRLARTLTP